MSNTNPLIRPIRGTFSRGEKVNTLRFVVQTSQSSTACLSPASGPRVGMNSWPT
jgi:hypothetical protein